MSLSPPITVLVILVAAMTGTALLASPPGPTSQACAKAPIIADGAHVEL